VNNYENEDVIINIVNYIRKSVYCEACGQYGCYLLPGQDIAEGVEMSFNAVKNVYRKTGGQLVQHIIVGFGDMDYISEEDLCYIAANCSLYLYSQGYQVFWGCHYGSDSYNSYRHIHIVINTVNGATGRRYSTSYENMGDLKAFMEKLVPDVPWQYEIKSSYFVKRY
jgi:hypothetical protein